MNSASKALVKQRDHQLAPLSRLRAQLAAISSAQEALTVADKASKAKQVYQAIGASVGDCNQYAEIYLAAYWKFGELVAGVPAGRPEKTVVDNGFPGSEWQRKYARKLNAAIGEAEIPEYVRVATENLEPASIAGCLEWLDPGRHGNLKGEYEWYTPKHVIELVRELLGAIDLDPASCEAANEIVQATKIFIEEENGLNQEWHGRVFLNPPFAHPAVMHFANKLAESFESGSVPAAVWLSNACTDTAWWHRLAGAGAVCFPLGRLKFYGPSDKGQAPTLGQSLIYLGDDRQKFNELFSAIGIVLS